MRGKGSGWVAMGLLLLTLLPVLSGQAAAGLPAWLTGEGGGGKAVVDPARRVWIVTTAARAPPTWHHLRVEAVALFVEDRERRRHYLYDLELVERRSGMELRIGREQIAQVRLYSKDNHHLRGAAVSIGYRPVVVLDDGNELADEIGGKARLDTMLRPSHYRFEKVEVLEVQGQHRPLRESSRFERPVIAFAWTEADTRKALEALLLQAARLDSERVFVLWNESDRVLLHSGSVEVQTRQRFTRNMSNDGRVLVFQGVATVVIRGTSQEYEFSHRCTQCLPLRAPPVNRWIEDSTGSFSRVHLGTSGVSLFYRTAPVPRTLDEVDLSRLNVSLSLSDL